MARDYEVLKFIVAVFENGEEKERIERFNEEEAIAECLAHDTAEIYKISRMILPTC